MRKQFTVRFLTTCKNFTIEQNAWWTAVRKRVERALEFAFFHDPRIYPHLFVSIVDAQVVEAGDDWTQMGFAAYHTGMYHILIASQKPDGVDDNEFLNDILPTHVFHEFKHFLQDCDGTLAFTDKCEKDAEDFSMTMLESWKRSGRCE